MTAHWRKPIDFTDVTLEQAKAQVESFRNALRGDSGGEPPEEEWERFVAALDDDFNTPEALAILHEWRSKQRLILLRRGLDVFGLGSLAESNAAPGEVQQMAIDRQLARDRKNFEESDRLRDQIIAAGWDIRDVAGGYQLVKRQ
jgi:cysteinyl-tRNA synthetase